MDIQKWCYSKNGENFTGDCDTRDQAIEEAKEDYGEDCVTIYVGTIKEVAIQFNADHIIEAIQENAYDQAGEYAEGYLDAVKQEHMKLLEERLHVEVLKWMDEFNYKPKFWTVENVEKITIVDGIESNNEQFTK